MPVITYTAVNRGELKSGHTAGNSYQIECVFEAFPRKRIRNGDGDESLSGRPEGWLQSYQWTRAIQTDLVLPAAYDDWNEFFSSVIGWEQFTVDFTGTISSPGTNQAVWLESGSIEDQQVGSAGLRFSFTVKNFPS